jgi:phenylalanyl-tRNA synthetase alpha subunit
MIKHIVMFKLKEEAHGQPKARNALHIKRELESLKQAIPEIRSIEVGINQNHVPGEWDLVLVSSFDDMEALLRYQKHPAHVKAGEFITEARSDRAFVDYPE